MKKVLKLAPFVVLAGFATGLGVVYARWHPTPGVDIPYDSSAYYSSTAISYADSPSTFTLRDIARNGGNVYDRWRHEQTTPAATDFVSWLEVLLQKNILGMLNIQSMDSDKFNRIRSRINSRQNEVAAMNEKNPYKELMDGKLFRDSGAFDYANEKNYDKQKQLKILEGKYSAIIFEAEKISKSHDDTVAAVQELVNAANNAKGEKEINQIVAQIDALTATEYAQRSALLAKLAELRSIKQKVLQDEYLEGVRNSNQAKLRVTDPYNPSEDVKAHFDRPKGVGFKAFE